MTFSKTDFFIRDQENNKVDDILAFDIDSDCDSNKQYHSTLPNLNNIVTKFFHC